jgi:nucleoside-diphosphate-sugar epimerase
MSKTLVTGGSGFLGSHLVEKLSSLGKYDSLFFWWADGKIL